nr:iron-containing alcohol dehydrogenase [uncultured Clostridium sp.]
MSYTMYVPTRTLFGAGMLNELHKQVMPGKKALIVISNGKTTRANGYLERTEAQFHTAGVETTVFDKIQANPLKSTVMLGAAFVRENNCDFIVALGGGSVMDAAKAIAVMATNDGDYWDYIGSGSGKGMPLLNKPLPIIAITTTAGTGSETDAACVITNEETHEKTGFGNPALFPVLAVVDPELMKTVPPKFTAYQGFDALYHSLECYISNRANLMGDMYALAAIENAAKFLPNAVADGNDMEAREKLAFANTLSGAVMTISGCTSEHSLEHAMSAYHQELPHGAGLIMISKAYFTHFIDKHVCDERFVRMAQVMGMENAREPMDFITMLTKLQKDCGVADLKMSDYGITPNEFGMMAQNAIETMGRLFQNDPTPLNQEDCIAIYNKSYQ